MKRFLRILLSASLLVALLLTAAGCADPAGSADDTTSSSAVTTAGDAKLAAFNHYTKASEKSNALTELDFSMTVTVEIPAMAGSEAFTMVTRSDMLARYDSDKYEMLATITESIDGYENTSDMYYKDGVA